MRLSIQVLSFLIVLSMSLYSSKLFSQDYYEYMSEKRAATIESLWQSERQPILPKDTINLQFFPIDKTYRLSCTLEFPENPEPFDIATYSGQLRSYILWATAHAELNGQKISLQLYQNHEQLLKGNFTDYLFLPFKDYTNGELSYGGGRYMNLSIEQIEAEGCILDFNTAYNPWCAYRDGFHCPIPPRANHLDIEIMAGEKDFVDY